MAAALAWAAKLRSAGVLVNLYTVTHDRFGEKPRDLPGEADQEGQHAVDAGAGVPGHSRVTDAPVPVKCEDDDDEARGADEGVAEDVIKMSEVICCCQGEVGLLLNNHILHHDPYGRQQEHHI